MLLAATGEAAVTVTFRDGVWPTGSYAGTRDTRVDDGQNFLWDPAANYDRSYLKVDGDPPDNVALMRWELTSIPASASVTSASLELSVRDNAGSESYAISPLLRPWVEGLATWRTTDGVTPWTAGGAQGGSDRGASMGSFTAPATGRRVIALDAQQVQKWIANPASNFGLIIGNITRTDASMWESSESPTVALRPLLRVVYVSGAVQEVTFQQDVGGYTGATDTTLASGPAPRTVNYGAGQLTLSTGDPQFEGDSQVLLGFDVTAIPPWATVEAARLEANVLTAAPYTYPLHEVRAAWGEFQATFAERLPGIAWEAPGASGPGDRGGEVLGTLQGPVVGPTAAELNAAGVALVQRWVEDAQVDHGLLLACPPTTRPFRIESSESSAVGSRPGFTVTYTEGRLVYEGLGAVAAPDGVVGPLQVRRESLRGVAVAAGASALPVSLSSSSPGGLFAVSPEGPWSATLELPIAEAGARTEPFYYRGVEVTGVTLAAAAGAAWTPAAAPLQAPAGEEPPAPSDVPRPVNLAVGCEAGGGGTTAALAALWLWRSRRAAGRVPRRPRTRQGRAL